MFEKRALRRAEDALRPTFGGIGFIQSLVSAVVCAGATAALGALKDCNSILQVRDALGVRLWARRRGQRAAEGPGPMQRTSHCAARLSAAASLLSRDFISRCTK